MDPDGAVHIPATPTHRLELSPARWRARAPRRYNDDARAYLWNLRWGHRGRDRGPVVVVLAVVLLAHVAAFTLLRLTTATPLRQPAVSVDERDVMQVRLIEPPPPSPAPPMQVLPPTQVGQPRPASPGVPPRPPPAAPSPPARPVAEKTPASTPQVHFYDAQGRVLLSPTPPAPAASVADYRPHLPKGSAKLMHPPPPPIVYTPTKLEKYFVPADENLLQKAVRKTLVKHTFHLPFGLNYTCVVAPLAVAGVCGFTAPEQLSAPLQVSNTRDNLAPATPLIRKPQPSTAASTVPAPAPAESAPAVPALIPPAAGSQQFLQSGQQR
ncbi:MAG TPA: hypothetical protein VFG73_01425 [Rhodanobacteraceae bacterium]|nr:hypothetical protein [Rhodanobacteraceae bacterium]